MRFLVGVSLKLALIVAAPVGLTCALLYLAGVPWPMNFRIGAVLAAFLFVAGMCARARIQRLVEQETGRESMAALPREPAVGLGLAAIAGLPVYKYEKMRSGGRDGDDECSVCLAEITPREVVKQLPACTHLFHDRCIDKWLWSHRTCPVCRSPVDASTVPPSVEVAARALQSV
ncbi:RING-H2 finger protein ATL32-like [Lolium perenne]|uniref:RING-H2 finger protein ATL32-like n=1 Tax=Lolium perenne TaxID=4522 RepID=UPI0021EADDD2|nr:RING-H2 finger protein ATL32-like [Lolium perenne]